jgi:hypothetical protein
LSNRNPSPHTRFRPGQSGNPGGKPGAVLDNTTVARKIRRALSSIRSLQEVLDMPDSFQGTPREFIEAAFRCPTVEDQVRLMCAIKLDDRYPEPPTIVQQQVAQDHPLFIINPVSAAPSSPYETVPPMLRSSPPEPAYAPPAQPLDAPPVRPPEAAESASQTETPPPRASGRPVLRGVPPPKGAELRTQMAAERKSAADFERRRIADVLARRMGQG